MERTSSTATLPRGNTGNRVNLLRQKAARSLEQEPVATPKAPADQRDQAARSRLVSWVASTFPGAGW